MNDKNQPKTIYLKDYQVPAYLIPELSLDFHLNEQKTRVCAIMSIVRNPNGASENSPLVLFGERLNLVDIWMDDQRLEEGDYQLKGAELTIYPSQPAFQLKIETTLNPSENHALEGLYLSGNIFCTQNEPEGFRRITYFIDRPDIMAKYTTTITADRRRFPVLLSNGNLVSQKDLDNGYHQVKWVDPFPKPSYLFALVAGNLGVIKDKFITCSNREIDLRIYCDKGNESRCKYAMQSLKNAMKWDETVFGLECDLDIYMIVAVDAFNMGAMENKGLNIFNTRYVLADENTATDLDFVGIEAVVGHEYFHNWTGNRVTCRDWFQLTLKEGLTVFRDQEFTADMVARSEKRIQDVMKLRAGQFAEDAGPMAHPIKPDHYIEINNFYTATIYNKGAEVIRMIHTLIGAQVFRKGMDIYFERFDGQAVTTEDFIYAMELASGRDFSQFKQWYCQSGTPEIKIETSYDSERQVYQLSVEQLKLPLSGQGEKQPFHFPFSVGLLNRIDGSPLAIGAVGELNAAPTSKILEISQEKEVFCFENIPQLPVLSYNRNFSAPIKVSIDQGLDDRLTILAHDTDDFQRWDANQSILFDWISQEKIPGSPSLELSDRYVQALRKLLKNSVLDDQFKSLCLALPSEESLIEGENPIDYEALHAAIAMCKSKLAISLNDELRSIYENCNRQGTYSLTSKEMGRRALKNICLSYLTRIDDPEIRAVALKQYNNSSNMTDTIGALYALSNNESDEKHIAFEHFYQSWHQTPLVIYKWMMLHAGSELPNTLQQVEKIEKDPVFNGRIPNCVRALIGTFSRNTLYFHEKQGSGYSYIARHILAIDPLNPGMAAALAEAFNKIGSLDEARKTLITGELNMIRQKSTISKNVFEIVSRQLALVGIA